MQFCTKVKESYIKFLSLQLGVGEEYFIFGEMVLQIAISVTIIGDLKEIITGFDDIYEGNTVKGLTSIGLGLVGIASLVFPWAKAAEIISKCVKFAKMFINTGLIKSVKATAGPFKDLLAAGAKLSYEGGEFLIKMSANAAHKIKYVVWCKILHLGCFVEGTPVLMANTFKNSHKPSPYKINSTKAIAVAAQLQSNSTAKQIRVSNVQIILRKDVTIVECPIEQQTVRKIAGCGQCLIVQLISQQNTAASAGKRCAAAPNGRGATKREGLGAKEPIRTDLPTERCTP